MRQSPETRASCIPAPDALVLSRDGPDRSTSRGGNVSTADAAPQAALITGAGRRIGACIARSLALAGWRVAVHFGTSATQAREVSAEIRAAGGAAVAVGGDLADAAVPARILDAAIDALGPVTCLVNNASLFVEDTLETLETAVWDRQHAVNLRAPMLLAQAFAQRLPDGLGGNIINIIDQRVLAPSPEFLSYSLSKAGLFAATPMLAQALAPRIRVNGIGPGPVLPSIYQDQASFADEVRTTLLGRATPPDEIAAAVRFILDAPSLTGQMIALDAGQHLSRRSRS
jgi:NAD(P)-dependent dehydrogenase (short-subunit alcohol dehydrogenase family)